MNCNVEILESFKYGTSQGIAELKAGEVYSGTGGDGGVVFHATLPGGKLVPIMLEANDGRVKIIKYANTAKV